MTLLLQSFRKSLILDLALLTLDSHNMSVKIYHSLEANILKTMNDSFTQVLFKNKSFRDGFQSLTLQRIFLYKSDISRVNLYSL
jgi:hypothetical protein